MGVMSPEEICSGVITETRIEDPDDPNKMSHYVEKNVLMEAMVFGNAVVALCQKIWIPTRDGVRFPVCPKCKELFENLNED